MALKAMQDMRGEAIDARDGRVGSVADVYFDDHDWAVRYLVVDTGNWLPGRKVLISPASLAREQDDPSAIRADLTREQVKKAPGTDTDPPISRMLEEAHARYFGYPFYWTGPYMWGPAPMPLGTPPAESREERELRRMAEQRAGESHVRSAAEVLGYRIRALDGELGHVEDFMVDDGSWAIRAMVVDTRNWLPGKKVAVPPGAISEVDWSNREVAVRLKREEVQRSPEA